MAEVTKKRKSTNTQELLKQVLQGQRRLEERMCGIETQQTLANQSWQRQGKVVEEINQRCMAKLGMKCPLVEDEENDNGGDDRSTE